METFKKNISDGNFLEIISDENSQKLLKKKMKLIEKFYEEIIEQSSMVY